MTKIHYSVEEQIAIITLDDGKMNAMNWEFFQELNDALDRALADKAKVLIFTGRQGIFSAGLDLKLLPTQSMEEQIRFQKTFSSTMTRIYMFPTPTIVAYAGHAVAGGAIFSYACDCFVAGDGPYRIQINEVANKMLIPTWITVICRSSIPPQWWKEALLHSRAYTPREAFEKGIVDVLVEEEGKVMEKAKEIARDMFKLYGPAYTMTKKFLRQKETEEALRVLDNEFLEWRLTSV